MNDKSHVLDSSMASFMHIPRYAMKRIETSDGPLAILGVSSVASVEEPAPSISKCVNQRGYSCRVTRAEGTR